MHSGKKKESNSNAEGISLNKYISSTGFCSRRDADKYIEQFRVTINGELATAGMRVSESDKIAIDGEPLKSKNKVKPIYIALNKPVGITSTTDLKDKTNIISFLNYPKRIFPIGRLDKDSDGLIFLTNDGDIVNKILRAANNHEKEYIVTVDKAITPEFITRMSNGIPMLGTITAKCFVKQEGSRKFRIILTQGLNRQIRRMCEHLDYKVKTLTRIRIMNVQLGNLASGKWRYLTPQEIDTINSLVVSSVKTEEASVKQYIPKKKAEPAKPVAQPKQDIASKEKKHKSYNEWRKKKK
ncbi:MAG: 23S rRNA pseudouridine(2604) synthase RluF [Bacteroidetes bacterium]|nr:23S rRNA pseudouridine(2604) synthase RluF [Bacteroidota bacterium]